MASIINIICRLKFINVELQGFKGQPVQQNREPIKTTWNKQLYNPDVFGRTDDCDR